ncbi:MAG: arylsulfatase A-like enzyme [Bacteroidia bacterium]
MGQPAGRSLLLGGWRDGQNGASAKEGAMVSSPTAELWLPSLLGTGSTLEMKVQAEGQPDGSFGLEVILGGKSLGKVELKAMAKRYPFEIPSGQLSPGLNRLELRTTRLDGSKGGLPVRILSAEILDASRMSGRSTSMRLPAGAQLEATAKGALALLVQDAATLEFVAEYRGEEQTLMDLASEAGREVIVTCWGDETTVEAHGAWRPANVVVVIVDTLRDDIIDETETPALDALIAEGVRFDRSFSHAPMTLPSHTALFSSRYPHVSGIVNNGQVVPEDLPLLADWLGRGGYKTRAVASLGTLWLNKPNLSLDRGFEQFSFKRGNANGDESVPLMRSALDDLQAEQPFFLFAHFADPHEPYRAEVYGKTPGSILLDGKPAGAFHPSDGPLVEIGRRLKAGKHRIEIECAELDFTVRAMNLWSVAGWRRPMKSEILEGNKGQPSARFVVEFDLPRDGEVELEMWLADTTPSELVQDRYQQEVVRADQAIGELVAALKKRDLWDNSLVIFTSDHGEEINERSRVGHVHTLFDEVVHVPLIVKLPRGEAWDGMEQDLVLQKSLLVRHIDVVPTILQVLGQAPLPGQMGTSLLEVKARILVTETHAPEAETDKYACRDNQLKLIFTPVDNRFEMFDVALDPGEKVDVFAERGHERQTWQALLRDTAERWQRDGAIVVDPSEAERLEGLGYL